MVANIEENVEQVAPFEENLISQAKDERVRSRELMEAQIITVDEVIQVNKAFLADGDNVSLLLTVFESKFKFKFPLEVHSNILNAQSDFNANAQKN